MNKKSLSLIGSILIALVFSIGLSYVHAAWTNPSTGPSGGNLASPITALSTAQVKQGGLSVNTFVAMQNAQFDQSVFFRGPVAGGDTAPFSPVEIGGGAAPSEHYVVVNVEGDVRSQGVLRSDQLVIANRGNRLCGDDQGHVVFCPQFTPQSDSIEAQNTSFDVIIYSVEIGSGSGPGGGSIGIQVPFSPGYPIAAGSPRNVATMTTTDSVTVRVDWNSNAISGQHVTVIDTNGNTQCTLVENGDPSSHHDFLNVDMTGPNILEILAEDGTC